MCPAPGTGSTGGDMKQISAKTVKIRKPHHCWGCTKEFPVGTELLAVTSEDGGKLSTVYWCITCDGWLLNHRNEWSEADGFECGDMLQFDSYPKPIPPNDEWKIKKAASL